MANIENLGVGAVDRIISRTDRLKANFSRDDKELSWDGFIYLFHHAGDNHSKKDSAGRVSVQIKGHKCKNVDEEKKNFSMEMSDIRNYLQDGGIIFFLVYITEDDEFVYYCNLLPYELRNILKEYGNQDSRMVYLKPFPKNKKDVEELVFNFLRDRDIQRAAISSEHYTLEDIVKKGMLESLSFGCTTIDKGNRTPLDYFFDHGMYIYADLPLGISLPIQHVDHIDSASTEIEQDVYVGDKLYYHKYSIVYKKDCEEICFGKCLTLNNPKEGTKGKINFAIQGTLKERINDFEFLICALQSRVIKIGEQEFPILDVPIEEITQFNISKRMEDLEYLKKVQSTLDSLHVKRDLDCDAMTKQDEYNLVQLVSAISDKNLIQLNDEGSLFGTYTVANIHLYVCVIKDDDSGLFRMYDILNAPLVLKGIDAEKKEFDSSICIKLKGDMLVNYDNIDYDVVVRELAKITPTEPYSQQLTVFLLEVIKVYDNLKLPGHPLLGLAKKIIILIQEKYAFNDSEINDLNFLQITLRERALNADELVKLENIVSNPANKKKYLVLTGAYILMDNQIEAEKNYYLMGEKERKAFDGYPINRYRKWRKKELKRELEEL